MANQDKLKQAIIWLLPSGTELIFYTVLSAITLVASNAAAIRNFLYTPGNLNLGTSILDSISNLVTRFLGDGVGRSAVVAIFWALVGLLAYVVIWTVINFSSELSNDLALEKYIHPKGVDTTVPLKTFVSRTAMRVATIIFLIFYINGMVKPLAPYAGGLYYQATQLWPKAGAFKYGLEGFLVEIAALHVLTLLIRFVLLKKRVFSH